MDIEFESGDLWNELSAYLKVRNRYVLDQKFNNFIKILLSSAEKRCKIIKRGKIFYRARIGCKDTKSKLVLKDYPLPKNKMLSPTIGLAKEGRINPNGISYLYLSDNETTAVSEVRPSLGQLVTVARCEILMNIKVVNTLSNLSFVDVFPCEKHDSFEKKENCIWYCIDRDLSWPINVNESSIEYAPTQFLAEVFKNAGYEGIFYRSSLSKNGHNLALFTSLPEYYIQVKETKLVRVTEIKYKYYEKSKYKSRKR